jgi:hypothetical protein
MARENPRKHRNERGDRAGLRGAHNSFAPVPFHDLHHRHGPFRPSTPSWCELAVTAVAVMCVAPALVVGLLLLLEAAQPNANRCTSASVAVECSVEAADTTRTP